MASFTFHANRHDLEELQHIVKSFNHLDDRDEIKNVLKQSGEKITNDGKSNLKTVKYKYSTLHVPQSFRYRTDGSGNKIYFKYNSRGLKTGNLRKAIKYTIKKNKYGIKTYAGFMRPEGNHAHLLDRGTKFRTAKRYGTYAYMTKDGNGQRLNIARTKQRGQVVGNNFWTQSVTKNGPMAQDRLNNAIENALTKITSIR